MSKRGWHFVQCQSNVIFLVCVCRGTSSSPHSYKSDQRSMSRCVRERERESSCATQVRHQLDHWFRFVTIKLCSSITRLLVQYLYKNDEEIHLLLLQRKKGKVISFSFLSLFLTLLERNRFFAVCSDIYQSD